ncbi:MAG TPA: ABC transporter permease, partial [Cupriavidus sp.]|nr:ABC transporter permease [Cupriavidus sp.]
MTRRSPALFLFALPALVVFLAFFCLPMARLIEVSLTG